MQITKNTSRTLKKLLGAVVAGAFAIAPMASSIVPVQAAPPVAERVAYQTLEGVVTIDRQQNRQFVMRLNNGQRVLVHSDEREPRRLSDGDRVRVRGFYRRNQPNIFRADSVQILTNQTSTNNTSFTGRVSRVESDQRFDIVVDNTTYNVFTTSRLPRRLNVNDQVRVYGRREGDNNITSATVVVVNNNNGNNNSNNGDYRTFTGRVSRVESDQRFDIVVDNATYNVFTKDRLPRRLDAKDKVRVYGRRDGNNNITNATVVLLKDSKDDKKKGSAKDYRTFTGRVINEVSDQRFDLVVGNMTYNVFTTSRLPRRLSNGDTVRVYGLYTDGNDITNATVTAINNNDNNNNGNSNDYRTFSGRVSRVESDQRFDVVVDNTTYNVFTTSRLPRRLNVNDQVRVYGRLTGTDDITNASVTVVSDNSNNNNGNSGDYRTFTGRVTDVRSDQRFGLIIGNSTYDVTSTSRLPRRLNNGDTVRVYGRRSGTDDILNATVVIINNR